MLKKALVFAVAAACLTSGAAFAQSYDYRSDGIQQRSNTYERHERHDRYDRSDRHDRYDRRDNRQDYSRHDGYDRYDGHNGYDSRSHAYRDAVRAQNRYERRQMRRGERLSQYNRGDYYVVSDWRSSSRLHAPQRGYHWVQAGNDYALVAIATGIIASVLLNH